MWILDWSWQVYRPLTSYLCRNPQNQVAWLVEPSLSPLSTHLQLLGQLFRESCPIPLFLVFCLLLFMCARLQVGLED